MTRKLTLSALFAWVALVAIAFGFYQFAGLVRANPFGDYFASALKVLAVMLVAASMGLRLIPGAKPCLRDIMLASAVGLALLGIATFLLGTVGLVRPYVIWPAVAMVGAISYRQIGQMLAWLRRLAVPSLDVYEMCFAGLMVFASLFVLANCLAPITANDALVYHLNLPKLYAAASGLVRLPYNVYANMPHYGEVLYTLFYSLAGETGARIFYFLVVMGATLSIYVLAKRFAPRRLAMAAAGFFLVQPLVLDDRIICNVDILLGYLYVSSVILLVDPPGLKANLRQILPVAVLAGFMLGIKYTAIAPCLSLLVIPLVGSPKRPRPRRFVIAGLVALALFAPWLIKNQVYVGNPFYPLVESKLDGSNWDATQEAQLLSWQRGMGMGRTALNYLLLPFNISTRGRPAANYTRFDGIMTPLFLILFPLALLRRRKETTALIVMVLATFVFWALTSQQLRFLIPTIALAAVLAAAGLANLAGLAGVRPSNFVLGLAILVTGSSIVLPDQFGRPFVTIPISATSRVVFGLEPRQQYLERTFQAFSMCEYVRTSLPPREPIFMVWENRGYYLDNPYFADSFYEASTLMRIVARSRDADDLKQIIRGMGFRYVLVNEMLGDVFSRSYPPAEVAKLREFMKNDLEAVHSAAKITLYRIAP
jgi:hypothetical protein